MASCRRCGASLAGRVANARFCSTACRRRWHRAANDHEPVSDDPDEAILIERKMLADANHVEQVCRCERPIGLVDEDGEATCWKCARPLIPGAVESKSAA